MQTNFNIIPPLFSATRVSIRHCAHGMLSKRGHHKYSGLCIAALYTDHTNVLQYSRAVGTPCLTRMSGHNITQFQDNFP